jgi:hypothetical protein
MAAMTQNDPEADHWDRLVHVQVWPSSEHHSELAVSRSDGDLTCGRHSAN